MTMDVDIVKRENGMSYNRHGERVTGCSTGCGRGTTMLGSKLCDVCWGATTLDAIDR